MGKKEEVFDALDQKWSKGRIMKHFVISESSYNTYKFNHKKHKEQLKAEQIAAEKIDEMVGENTNITGLKEAVKNQSIIFITVDIEMKNDFLFKECSVFKPFPKAGQESIQSITEIQSMFDNKANYWHNGFICFQNEWINGTIHVDNIKSYKLNVNEI
jgi:hypothetical protein